jgi:hypothetical protein
LLQRYSILGFYIVADLDTGPACSSSRTRKADSVATINLISVSFCVCHPKPNAVIIRRAGLRTRPTLTQKTSTTSSSAFETATPTNFSTPTPKVSVLWPYKPRATDEFALCRGEMLRILSICDDGWALGYRLGERADEWIGKVSNKPIFPAWLDTGSAVKSFSACLYDGAPGRGRNALNRI